ncbi:transaldolase [Candidatus Pacearchaeota archaeon]|nr:transaldolase [Candidatus Pacearchaeota archaeon]
MQIFLDSADIEEIKEARRAGILDGVTTNPSLIKKAVEKYKNENPRLDLEQYIKDLLIICKGKPVSLEVIGNTFEEMINEGVVLFKRFNKVAKNVYVKIPINPCMEKECTNYSDGIKAIKYLSSHKIPVNCTLILTPEQALLAAKSGARFVSPFIGREDDYIREINKIKFKKEDYFTSEGIKIGRKILDDNSIVSGINLLKEIVEIFRINKIKSKVLAASVRNKRQFREAALAGADIITVPYSVYKELLTHEKTAEGMKKFTEDVVEEYKNLLR